MRRLTILPLAMVLLRSACNTGDESTGPIFTDLDDGSVVSLSVGDTFVVELPGLGPSAGFTWRAVSSDLCRLVESEFEPVEDGAEWEGLYTFTFEAEQAGRDKLAFDWRTGGSTVAGTYTLTLEVQP
jgi:predicted secreted protein